MTYSPQYVQVDDVPVQIPDDYEDYEKLDAIEFAETSLELDLNDGEAIPSDSVTSVMRAAVKQKATCELAKGAEHPDDASLTDLSTSGADKAEYAADAFCNRYDELIDKIIDSGQLEKLDLGGDSSDPFVYSTSDPTPSTRWD
jgi:hypothetical protein